MLVLDVETGVRGDAHAAAGSRPPRLRVDGARPREGADGASGP